VAPPTSIDTDDTDNGTDDTDDTARAADLLAAPDVGVGAVDVPSVLLFPFRNRSRTTGTAH